MTRHAPGQRHHGPARAHADRGGAARPCRCGPRRADPRAGDWHRPEDRLRAGRRRPGEAAALQDRSGAVQGRLRSSHRPAQAGAGQSVQRQGAGRSPRRWSRPTRSASRNTTTPWRRTARPGRGRRQGRAGQRLDQPRLHRRDLAHHRTHRQAAGHRGRAGRGTSATQMATVQQLDPIYIDFNQSTTDLAALPRLRQRKLQQVGKDAARATVVLEDGSEYPHRASCCSPASRLTRPPVRSTCAPRCRTRRTCCCRACMCA